MFDWVLNMSFYLPTVDVSVWMFNAYDAHANDTIVSKAHKYVSRFLQ